MQRHHADPVEPVFGAQVDLELVAIAQRVVGLDQGLRADIAIGGEGTQNVTQDALFPIDSLLSKQDDVLTRTDDLDLGQPGPLPAEIADWAALLIG